LSENGSEFVKIQRFGEMEIEPGFPAESSILFRHKSGQRYRANCWLFLPGLREQGIAAPIRKPDVAEDDIESLRVYRLHRSGDAGGHGDFMPNMAKKVGQDIARFTVIFDHQDP
jgi:hypothetical protein